MPGLALDARLNFFERPASIPALVLCARSSAVIQPCHVLSSRRAADERGVTDPGDAAQALTRRWSLPWTTRSRGHLN